MDIETVLYYRTRKDDQEWKRKMQLETDARFNLGMAEIVGNRFEFFGKCPCGKHTGVTCFIDEKAISSIMCPVHVYNVRLRDSVRKGRGADFVKASPFSKWMEVANGKRFS